MLNKLKKIYPAKVKDHKLMHLKIKIKISMVIASKNNGNIKMIREEKAIEIIKIEGIKIIEMMVRIDKETILRNIEEIKLKVRREDIKKTFNSMNHLISGNFIKMIHNSILMLLEKKIPPMISKYIYS